MIACCDIAMGLTFQLLPLLMESRGIPAWIMGLNAAMSPLGILLIGPFLPAIIARFGSKPVAIAVVLAIIFSLLSFKIFDALWIWFIVRFIFGLAAGTLFAISEAWLLTVTEQKSRGRVMGIYTTVLAVSFAVGPAIIPFTGIFGWTPWLIGIACVALSAAPMALVSVSDEHFRSHKGGSFFAFVRKAPVLLLAVASVTIFDSILMSFFPIFGLRSGLSLQTVSWVLAAGIVGNVFIQYPIGILADKWSRISVIIIASGITALLSVAMIWAVEGWLIWPTVIILGSAAFASYTVALAAMGDHFDGPDLIAGAAAFGAMWGVGGVVGPPIAGIAVDLAGINAIPLSLAAVYLLLLCVLGISGGKLVRGGSRA
jgi:MFS family permease